MQKYTDGILYIVTIAVSSVLVIYSCKEVIGVPISPAQRKAVAKYNAANYDRIELRVPKGQKEKVKIHSEACGESVNAFINRAICEAMERDKNDVAGRE